MKKVLTLTLALILAFSLSACSGKSATSTPGSSGGNNKPTSTPKPTANESTEPETDISDEPEETKRDIVRNGDIVLVAVLTESVDGDTFSIDDALQADMNDNSLYFYEGLFRVSNGEKWGFINKELELVIPFEYDKVHNFSEGLAAVELNDKWGFIDKSGKMVIEPQYNDKASFPYRFVNGLARVLNGHDVQYIDKTGKLVLEPSNFQGYGDMYTAFQEGLAISSGRKGSMYFNIKGDRVTIDSTEDIQTVGPFRDGYAICLISDEEDSWKCKLGLLQNKAYKAPNN